MKSSGWYVFAKDGIGKVWTRMHGIEKGFYCFQTYDLF